MNTLLEIPKPQVSQVEWFKRWFDSTYYHKLYSHRDDREAAAFIDELITRLQPDPDSRMIDLGCGAGRHSRYLASKGFRVTGLDLSARSIAAARTNETASLRFLRHDMRLPFGTGYADYVFNLFTSFGYFAEEEHCSVMHNISEAMKPGGTVVIDYLNVHHTDAHLVPYEEKEIDGIFYRISRWKDDNHFFKTIRIMDGGTGPPLEYTERVARFTLGDFNNLFGLHNLRIDEVYGDYHLRSFKESTSPRLIVVARKVGREMLRLPACLRCYTLAGRLRRPDKSGLLAMTVGAPSHCKRFL